MRGLFQEDFKYGDYDDHHTYHEGEEKGTPFSPISLLYNSYCYFSKLKNPFFFGGQILITKWR